MDTFGLAEKGPSNAKTPPILPAGFRTGEFDARLMQAADGAIICKAGAEGVHGTAVIDRGVGMVVKVMDGAARARAPAVLAAIRALGLLDEGALTKLADLERPIVYNRAGRAVGTVRPASTSRRLKSEYPSIV